MERKKGWIETQAQEAMRAIETWPEWMREATRVGGGEPEIRRETREQPKNQKRDRAARQ